ncbi:hypothetical protein CQA48_30345, partial [Klebsiella pneumoniae]
MSTAEWGLCRRHRRRRDLDWQWVAAGFVIFRIFDIVEAVAIRGLIRNIHGGMGI